MVQEYDQVRVLYRTMLTFAAVAIVILTIGLVEFVYFEPPGEASGLKARIVGVYTYDPVKRTTVGPDRSSFPATAQFAAVVDWSSLPAGIVVDARWYDSFGNVVGSVGPGSPARLADNRIVPALVPQGLSRHLPGHYLFVVERYDGGVPVEVLARRIVRVDM